MSTRTDWVDYAKAIGIILVVYGHVAKGIFNAGIEMPDSLYRLTDSIVYSFHMPLFFFLSGLFFYQSFSKRGGIGLTLNKIDTIVYPFVIWSVLQGSIEVLLSNYTNGDVGFSEVFSLWEPRAQFWFLYALFFVFIISCAIFYFVPERFAALVFLVACVLFVGEVELPDVKPLLYTLSNIAYFAFGIVFTKYNLSKLLSSSAALLITMMAFILSQYLFHGYLGKLYFNKGIESLLLACVSILFVVSLSIVIARRPNRFFAYIGASSMAIYLMHILAGSGARVILSKFLNIDSMYLHIVVGCIAGVMLPLWALKVIHALRIPYVFSAPISRWLEFLCNKIFHRVSH